MAFSYSIRIPIFIFLCVTLLIATGWCKVSGKLKCSTEEGGQGAYLTFLYTIEPKG